MTKLNTELEKCINYQWAKRTRLYWEMPDDELIHELGINNFRAITSSIMNKTYGSTDRVACTHQMRFPGYEYSNMIVSIPIEWR